MWFAIKTKNGEEETSKELLLNKILIVRDVFVPKQQITRKDSKGNVSFSIEPLIHGFCFADIRINEKDVPQPLSYEVIWNELQQNVNSRGYFFYRDTESGEIKNIPGAHMLSGDVGSTSPDKFIFQSRISDNAMEAFMQFVDNDGILTQDIKLVGGSFEELAQENDEVRVLTGPLAGLRGLVYVKKTPEKGKNFKNRHLAIRFSNSLYLSFEGIRRYELALIREARQGERARVYHLRRESDQLIGQLQRKYNCPDDAAKKLGEIICKIRSERKSTVKETIKPISEVIYGGKTKLFVDEPFARRIFAFIAEMPLERGHSIEENVNQTIPDYPIRPFLTPSEGEEAYTSVQTLKHSLFDELVIPVNLKKELSGQPCDPDSNYAYNAHVAVFSEGGQPTKAIVSWGSFYEAYTAMDEPHRTAFLEDLNKKKYTKNHTFFSTGHPYDAPTSLAFAFEEIGGIGGISVAIQGNLQEAIAALKDAAVHAALEFLRKESLRTWRKYIEQSVFIHKQDQPTAICNTQNVASNT